MVHQLSPALALLLPIFPMLLSFRSMPCLLEFVDGDVCFGDLGLEAALRLMALRFNDSRLSFVAVS